MQDISSTTTTTYEPLKNYQTALSVLQQFIPPQELTKTTEALQIYSSHSDLNQISKEEVAKIFPALFNIGKANVTALNNPTEGFKWFSQALIFGEKAELSGNVSFVSYYQEMAFIFSENNQLKEAIDCLEKTLVILNSIELSPEELLSKCNCLMNKGSLHRSKKDLDGAAEAIAQCIAILEGIPESKEAEENLVEAYEMIVNIHYHRHDQEKAHEYSKKGLEFMDKVLGKDSFKGHNLAREFACTLFKQKRLDEALVYVEKWENMLRRSYGENDPHMLACYFLYGQICSLVGKYVEALDKFGKVEKVTQENKNAKFNDSGEVFIYKTRCHFNLGNLKEAKENFEKAVEYNTNKSGVNSKKLADCYYTGADIFRASEQFKDETKDLYSKSLEIYRSNGPACLFETMSTLGNFGVFLTKIGEHKEAVKFAEESLEICKQHFPTNLERLESAHNVLGMAQFVAGDIEKALENLHLAVKICEDLNDCSGNLISHYFNLVKAYSKTEQYEKTEQYGRKVLEMDFAKNGKEGEWIKVTLEYLAPVFSNLKKDEEFKKLEATYTS